ncbi:MAG: tRNA (adenosine(37)-N6)-dimethylallyltransferase MiaA [Mollicutes bacterium]|nr:tRNA (adenosine(37)-N6)-dimethylallyltransferase MiaA [Mollicutes bacterium]
MKMVIVIVGPTGIGKTKLSIALAKKLNGEIINADSTQIYRGLDIATAKITIEEMGNIIHHLLDIKNIKENYTVYDYQKDSRRVIDSIIKRDKTPIMVGGTGLYIKASLYDYTFYDEPVINNYDEYTNEELFQKLLTVDPNTTIHLNNRKRVIRALNYYDIHKKPFSEKEKTDKLLYNAIFIGLTTDRKTLYERINKRVDEMLTKGLLEEARKIYESGIRTKAVITPIGYKELFDYFENKKSLEECIELIKKKSRNYAKRQYTWFNNQMPINWINVDFDNFDNTIKEALKLIEKNK